MYRLAILKHLQKNTKVLVYCRLMRIAICEKLMFEMCERLELVEGTANMPIPNSAAAYLRSASHGLKGPIHQPQNAQSAPVH